MPTFLEAIEDDSRANYQFDQTGGSGKAYYHTPVGSSFDVQDIVQTVIGYTNPTISSTSQALRRQVPITHPKCPYLYAHRVSSLVGKGSGTAVQEPPTPPRNPAVGVKPAANYFKYQQYEVGIEFSSRPYPIIADADITQTVNGSWYKKNGTLETFTYAPEWVRYVDYDYFPQNNTIQGQQGNMSLIGVPSVTNPPPFTSPPWMWLPDQLLKIKWFQVPYRFITSQNSYIAPVENRNWRGRVNQNWWWNWGPGTLLYMSYEVHKYTPPTFDIGTYPSYTGTILTGKSPWTGTLLNYERLCDITLTFLYTQRFMSGSLGAALTNNNYINAGHNLLPNLGDGKFYYATRNPIGSATGNVQNPPPWYSFPMEIMFSDPDAPGGPTTSGDN